MIKIQDKQQIFSTSFMVLNNQEIEIEVPMPNNHDTLYLYCKFMPGTNDEARATWASEGANHIKFTFVGWHNPLGACVMEPIKFGNAGNKNLYFQLAQHFVGNSVNLAHLFIFLGESNE